MMLKLTGIRFISLSVTVRVMEFQSRNCILRVLGPERFIVLLGMHFMNESMNDAQVTKRVIGVMVHEEFDSISHVTFDIKFLLGFAIYCLNVLCAV